MGKRVVITCWGSHGDLFPYVGLALALNARGHSAVVGAFRPRARAARHAPVAEIVRQEGGAAAASTAAPEASRLRDARSTFETTRHAPVGT